MPQLTERNQLIYHLYLQTFRLSFKSSSVYENVRVLVDVRILYFYLQEHLRLHAIYGEFMPISTKIKYKKIQLNILYIFLKNIDIYEKSINNF